MNPLTLLAWAVALSLVIATFRSYIRAGRAYAAYRDTHSNALARWQQRAFDTAAEATCCARSRHEVSSPIDTVEVCIHCGHRRPC